MPVAWKATDPVALGLSPQEAANVREVQQIFQTQVQGPNLDPSDPLYAALWQQSQVMADDMLAARLSQPRFDQLRSDILHAAQSGSGQ